MTLIVGWGAQSHHALYGEQHQARLAAAPHPAIVQVGPVNFEYMYMYILIHATSSANSLDFFVPSCGWSAHSWLARTMYLCPAVPMPVGLLLKS